MYDDKVIMKWDAKRTIESWRPATRLRINALIFQGRDVKNFSMEEVAPSKSSWMMASMFPQNASLDWLDTVVSLKIKSQDNLLWQDWGRGVLNSNKISTVSKNIDKIDVAHEIAREEILYACGLSVVNSLKESQMWQYDKKSDSFSIYAPVLIDWSTGFFHQMSNFSKNSKQNGLQKFIDIRDDHLKSKTAGATVVSLGYFDEVIKDVWMQMITLSRQKRFFARDIHNFIIDKTR